MKTHICGFFLIAVFYLFPNMTLGKSDAHISFFGPKTWNIWDGSSSTNWTDPLNWSAGVPTSTSRVKISGTATFFPVTTSVVDILDLEIETGASLTISNSSMIVRGLINNYGTLNASNGTITLFGSSNGSINGNSIDVSDLVINKAALSDTVFINTTISVLDEVLFITGLVYTGLEEVVFLDGSDNRNGSDKSFIEGNVRKIGPGEFTFPIGQNGLYAPLTINHTGSNTEEFSASYYNESPDSANYNTSNFDPGLVNVSSCEYWILNHDVGTAKAKVTLSYGDERSCGVLEPWNLNVVRWDGATWDNHGSSGYTGDAIQGTVESLDSISNFSPFTLGSTSFANPLPVELLSFDVQLDNEQVLIEWATATETNCDYYLVERSKDLLEFTPVSVLAGSGNSTSTLNYKVYDDSAISGTWYYRLKQFDYDGQFEVFSPKSIAIDPVANLGVYPNPAVDKIRIIQNGLGDDVAIKIFDSRGHVIKSIPSSRSEDFIFLDDLNPGLYIVEASGKKGLKRTQLIKN